MCIGIYKAFSGTRLRLADETELIIDLLINHAAIGSITQIFDFF